MRIGVDLLALQAPSCRGRGIGRYAQALLEALLAEPGGREWVFYRRTDLGIDWDDRRAWPQVQWVDVPPDPSPSDAPDGTLQQIAQRNPDRLDWLLVLNPLVERRGYALPEPVPGGPRLAAVVLDLIPLRYPRHYLDAPGLAGQYAGDLRRLQSYDRILAISEATGRDVEELLNIPARRIANIRAAIDPEFFHPARTDADHQADARWLARHGVREPFLYYLGNVDWRKNVLGLVEAFARLPEALRATYPLVLTFGRHAWFERVLAETLDRLGLTGHVIVTGPAADEAVRALYRRCALFLSPSLYEGFGLPILEAMSCGAAVVVADNSSQPEVVGTAGRLVRSGDAAAWAEAIEGLVADPGRIAAMRAASERQASRFSWRDSARRLLAALDSCPPRPGLAARDRLALVVHASPREPGGFGAEAARLFEALTARPGTTIFLETDRAVTLPSLPLHTSWHEATLLDRIRPVLRDPPVLHLVDRLDSLGPLIRTLRAHRGLVAFAGIEDISAGDDELRAILRLATGVACRSPALRDRLGALDQSVSIHQIPAGDVRLAADGLAALAQAPETLRCPA